MMAHDHLDNWMLAPLHNRSRVIMFYGLPWIRGDDLSA